MSLDGLRAWIGLVERRLTMRTRVFLVLVAIAIGGAATGIVLAVDAQDNAVSKDDLQAVRDELAGTTAAPAEAPQTTELQAEVETLKAEIATLRSESEARSKSSGKEASGGTGSPAEAGGSPAPQHSEQPQEPTEEGHPAK